MFVLENCVICLYLWGVLLLKTTGLLDTLSFPDLSLFSIGLLLLKRVIFVALTAYLTGKSLWESTGEAPFLWNSILLIVQSFLALSWSQLINYFFCFPPIKAIFSLSSFYLLLLQVLIPALCGLSTPKLSILIFSFMSSFSIAYMITLYAELGRL